MAHPPGNWDQYTAVNEFDLDESRATGWCLDIEFAGRDPVDGVSEASFMLEGFSWPYFVKEPGAIDQIRVIRSPDQWRNRDSGSLNKYGSIVGVLPTPDTPADQASKKIMTGSFLVLGNPCGAVTRIMQVPIRSIVRSFIDLGG